MEDQLSTRSQIFRLWGHLLPRRKKQLALMFILMLIASFAEAISISAVMPFLALVSSPEKIFNHYLAQPIIASLYVNSAYDLLLPFTLIFSLAAIIAGLVRIVLLWFQVRLSTAIGVDLSVQVYERTLYQPYSLHVLRNSSEIMAGTVKAENLANMLIKPFLFIISSVVILLAIIAILLVIEPTIAFTALVGFGLIYAAVAFVIRGRIAKNSQAIAIQQGRVNKAIQEGLGGIRDVLIDGTQPVYSKLYRDAFVPMQIALASNQVAGGSPRYGVEALGMVLIAGLAFTLVSTNESLGAGNAIPVLGALALGAQRLLPVLQQIYLSYITIKGYQVSIRDALYLLDQPMPRFNYAQISPPISFRSEITLKDLSFRYTPDGPWVLRNLNLQIPKGSRVGFIGVTGSGKSTLLDILMGLLTPTEGLLLVDNTAVSLAKSRAWQAHISHVPQAIYLADTSIAANIAFGVPAELIDLQRVEQAAHQAQIAKTIESLPNGYNTLVGERGVRLSGGQRQRIGIARALYKQANVIIFDEATSALDNETEAAVMEAVENLGNDITVVIVAHRLTTLKSCSFIVELANGGIKAVGGFEQTIRRLVS